MNPGEPRTLRHGAIAAVSLDLDDTLWPVWPTLVAAEQTLTDWLSEHAPATAAWLTPENRSALRQRIVQQFPKRLHDVSWIRHQLLAQALEQSGCDPALADRGFDVFLRARQQVTLYDDVEPLLRRWSDRYRLIAISNGNADLKTIGLGRYFSVIISAHQVGMAKPDPAIFQLACREAGLAPSQVCHIGDDIELDYHAARRAGLQAAWIRRPDLLTRRPHGDACAAAQAIDPVTGEPVRVFTNLHELDVHLDTLGDSSTDQMVQHASGQPFNPE